MKEHDMLSMENLDDISVEEISETVNSLTQEDKDKIFESCMSKMNAAAENIKNIKVKRKGLMRFIPFMSAAACLAVFAGIVLVMSHRLGLKSDTAVMENATASKSDSASDSFDYKDSSNDASQAEDEKTDDCFTAEDEYTNCETNDSSADEYLSAACELTEKFDFANALASNCPLLCDEEVSYEKTENDMVFQYRKVNDSRVVSVSGVEDMVRAVFSERYCLEECSNLTQGEYPLYEEKDGQLYTRSLPKGWEFEWTDEVPLVIAKDSDSFTFERSALFMGQEKVLFTFDAIREGSVWKIDSYSKQNITE